MGIFISAISKNKTSVTKMVAAKLNSGELEANLNTDYDDLIVYSNKTETTCIVNFVTKNTIYKAEQTYYLSDTAGFSAIQGDIILRNTELTDMDFLSANEVYRFLDRDGFEAFKSKTSGSYSVIYANGEQFIAGNDSMGIEHIYYAQTDEHIFISNRIRFIRLFLADKAHTDLLTLSNIALMGSVLGVDTSVKEVKKIPQGSYITVNDGIFHLHKNDLFFYNNPEVSEECERDFTGFIKKELNVCTNKVSAVLKKSDNFSLALSGGKDSRSMLAMLFRIRDKKDISVFTNGYDNHPDVVVAKMIAEHYNLRHTVNTPKAPKDISAKEILEKLMGSVFQTDGMIGLFDAKGNKISLPFNLALPGHINELFRSHTNKSIKISSLNDVINYYKNIHLYDPLNMMLPPLLDEFKRKFTERAEYYAATGMSFEDVNNTYFISDRVPNWVGYLLRTDGYSLTQLQAVNNDRLIQAFYRDGCAEMRKAELLHFIIMKEYGDNWLVECPFAAQQWSPLLTPWAEGVNITSPAVPVPPDIPHFGTWQHKLNSSPELKVKLLDIFMSFPNSDIWQMFDKDRVIRSLMSDRLSYTPLISMYGFINMFFYYHSIELPVKIKSGDRKVKPKNVVIRLSEGSTIMEYDNNNLKKFESYDELKESGLAGQYRFTISPKAADICLKPDTTVQTGKSTDAVEKNENLRQKLLEKTNENERLRATITEIRESASFRLAKKLSLAGNRVKPIKNLAKKLLG